MLRLLEDAQGTTQMASAPLAKRVRVHKLGDDGAEPSAVEPMGAPIPSATVMLAATISRTIPMFDLPRLGGTDGAADPLTMRFDVPAVVASTHAPGVRDRTRRTTL